MKTAEKSQLEFATINVIGVKMVKESSFLYEIKTIRSPEDAAKVIRKYLRMDELEQPDRECFVVLFLDTKNNIAGIHTASIGSLNASVIHPREIFKLAILANSASVILAHNHPSGDCRPSREDIDVTKRIVEAGNILGIEVLDHVVVGDENYYSLKENGMM